MQRHLNAVKELAPDLLKILENRYQVLQKINLLEPIGRRSLATELNISERRLRTEIDFLRDQNLIICERKGMSMTEIGRDVLKDLADIIYRISDMNGSERLISQYFGIKSVVIVPGDLDKSNSVLSSFAYVLSDWLEEDLSVQKDNIISVIGGTTLQGVANYLRHLNYNDILFVSGRGGMGDSISSQSNTVAAKMAERIGGKCVSLHIPENMSQETYKNLLVEPIIKSKLELINNSTIAIHSIGQALEMAKKREMDENEIALLKKHNAIAEVFGTFYNSNGDIVYQIPSIGLQYQTVSKFPNVYAIVGGSSKATAITAYLRKAPSQTKLLIDEGAANSVLKGLSL